ncbi:hypothetical protein Dsin_031923 [Dipteronia sinensis]|uniref:PGG domain-containing protein n=1 Tax=Dipteronia sinensis TaxID=43782 RepID=A0AAE0DSU2_9ROSI|nr:hypothetical protein Dsin_031923 [Dipteronia sinensis]
MDGNNPNQMIKTLTAVETNIQAKKDNIPDPPRGSNGAHHDKLASLHNAIIIVCSLLATCCFEAIISPPGGFWQTRPSKDVIHAENITTFPAFFKYFMYTSKGFSFTDLLAPNKAMSMALQPNDFVDFLLADATCFMASLMTIYIVTLAVCLEKKGAYTVATVVMLHVVIISAIFLYTSIIELTSDAGVFVSIVLQIGLVIMSIPTGIIFAPYFVKHCWPPISSRLDTCYSQICNRYQKMKAKVCC